MSPPVQVDLSGTSFEHTAIGCSFLRSGSTLPPSREQVVDSLPGAPMRRTIAAATPALRLVACLFVLLMALPTWAAEPAPVPVRLAVVGLVHGHVRGFLDRLKGRTDVQLVGVVDPDASLRDLYRERYALAPEIFHGTV